MSQRIITPARDFMESLGWRWGKSAMRTPSRSALALADVYRTKRNAANREWARAAKARSGQHADGAASAL